MALTVLKRPSIRFAKLDRYSNEIASDTGDNGTGGRKEAIACHETDRNNTWY